jgi:probable HAF family extracellular repeat protein
MERSLKALTVFKRHDRVLLIFCFIAAILVSFALPAFAAIEVERTDLGTLGGSISVAYGINNSGQIVGESTIFDPATHGDTRHAFFWENGVLNDLGTLTVNWSSAAAINNAGQIAGTSGTAVLLQDGTMSSLGTLGSSATDINDAGQVVGQSYLDPSDYSVSHAFLWQNGAMTDLGTLGGNRSEARAINNSGQVAGWSQTADGETHAFFWDNGKMIDLGTLGGTMSEAHGINDKGQVVGFSMNESGLTRAFIWENGRIKDLDPANPYSFSRAYDINNSGQVVGISDSLAALWQDGIRNMLDSFDDASNSMAYRINDKGQIVGYHAFWHTTGNRAIRWTVKGPLEQLNDLTAQLSGYDLPQGLYRSLSGKLANAIKALGAENIGAACGDLAGFMNEISAQSGKAIPLDQAESLISSANGNEGSLACSK